MPLPEELHPLSKAKKAEPGRDEASRDRDQQHADLDLSGNIRRGAEIGSSAKVDRDVPLVKVQQCNSQYRRVETERRSWFRAPRETFGLTRATVCARSSRRRR